MTYDTKTASRQNDPSYFMTVEGITTEEYSTHPVKGAVLPKVECLQIPSGTSQKLSPLQGRASVGEVRVRVVDKGGKITNLLSTIKPSPLVPTIVNRIFTLHAGYREEPESQFQIAFVGELRKCEQLSHRLYEITLAARTRKLNDMLMKGISTIKTKISGNLGTQVLQCESVSGFSAGQSYVCYRRTGAQYEKVTVSSVNTGANQLNINAPLKYAWQQNSGDVVTNCPFIRGNLINILYSLLTNSFSKDPRVTSYPLVEFLNAPTGLDFLASDVDLPSFDKARDAAFAEFDLDFLFENEIQARRFFEEQIFALGLYQTYTATGKFGVRAFLPPGPESSATNPKIQKEHMIGPPTLRLRILEHLNRIQITGDHDISNTIPEATLVLLEDTTDQTNTREVGEFKIQSLGLRTALQGTALAQEIAQRISRRWKVPPVEIECKVAFTKRGLNPGDIVYVSHPELPDFSTGTMGLVDHPFEVTDANPNWPDGVVDLVLLDSAFGRFGRIGPASMNDYPSQTATEKQYASWGDASNMVNAGTEAGFVVF